MKTILLSIISGILLFTNYDAENNNDIASPTKQQVIETHQLSEEKDNYTPKPTCKKNHKKYKKKKCKN